jgi:hypothetical protein
MAKTPNGGDGEDKQDGGDAPLIDLNEASIKKLLARAKKRGVITYDELNEALPQDQMNSEQIEDVMSALNDMGVNIVEADEGDDEDSSAKDEPDADAEDDGTSGENERFIVEKKKETVDRTDDPVRMYLREMGAVELLSCANRPSPSMRSLNGPRTSTAATCSFARSSISTPCCPRARRPNRSPPRKKAKTARSPKPPPAPPSRKKKKSRKSPRRRMRTATSSSAPPARPSRKRKRTTPFPSPRWRKR